MSTSFRARAALLALAAVLALTGCASASDPQPEPTASASADPVGLLLETYDLADLDARQIIDRLEATPVAERPADLRASVRPDSLLLSTLGGDELSMPLPAGEFYLSFAPYLQQSHDCFFHSLTTCLGELRGEAVDVLIVASDGTVLVDEALQTNDNGFVGVWLPRGVDAELTVRHEGGSVTLPVSTGEDAPTCLTTLQLT